MSHGLKLNQEYSKEDIEEAFDTQFGSMIKGITLRKFENGEPYILLFATAKGAELYGDRVDGDTFYYIGEGQEGDQKLTVANKALLESNTSGRVIYGFRQEVKGGLYRFLGLVTVRDYAYIEQGKRKVYEFKMVEEGIEEAGVRNDAINDILDRPELPTLTLTAPVKHILKNVTTIVRDNAFRVGVKQLYDNTCVVCGKKRFSAANYPEVESAHIYPKEKNGADDFRNGIALCRFHHWAFDGGLWAISNDFHVIIREEIMSDNNYDEIIKFEGVQLRKPRDMRYLPEGIYLAAHRSLHGF